MGSDYLRKRDFPGGPVVKTLPSNAGGAGLIPGQRAKISHALGPKNQNINRSNVVKNSTKTLKMVHIKKKKKSYLRNDQMACSNSAN